MLTPEEQHFTCNLQVNAPSLRALSFFFSPQDKNNKCDVLFEVIKISFKPILNQQPTAVILCAANTNVDSTNPSEKVPSVLLLRCSRALEAT